MVLDAPLSISKLKVSAFVFLEVAELARTKKSKLLINKVLYVLLKYKRLLKPKAVQLLSNTLLNKDIYEAFIIACLDTYF
ncbi:hypothetical protein [Pseudoalteromonas sp. SIMBA_162]|uniref:hypothetical protein n=1 Tax=Pseudoalteromonas sp. SIMBA_162 TaxID=3080867 RepID=UPI00397E2468